MKKKKLQSLENFQQIMGKFHHHKLTFLISIDYSSFQ